MRLPVPFIVPTVAAVVGVALASVPSSAARLPHLKLKQSFPAKDTVLTMSPDAIRLWLTEKADLPATRITLSGADNAAIVLAKPTRAGGDDAPIEARVSQALPTGRYTVTWKTMSKDGHVVNGTFGFSIKAK